MPKSKVVMREDFGFYDLWFWCTKHGRIGTLKLQLQNLGTNVVYSFHLRPFFLLILGCNEWGESERTRAYWDYSIVVANSWYKRRLWSFSGYIVDNGKYDHQLIMDAKFLVVFRMMDTAMTYTMQDEFSTYSVTSRQSHGFFCIIFNPGIWDPII